MRAGLLSLVTAGLLYWSQPAHALDDGEVLYRHDLVCAQGEDVHARASWKYIEARERGDDLVDVVVRGSRKLRPRQLRELDRFHVVEELVSSRKGDVELVCFPVNQIFSRIPDENQQVRVAVTFHFANGKRTHSFYAHRKFLRYQEEFPEEDQFKVEIVGFSVGIEGRDRYVSRVEVSYPFVTELDFYTRCGSWDDGIVDNVGTTRDISQRGSDSYTEAEYVLPPTLTRTVKVSQEGKPWLTRLFADDEKEETCDDLRFGYVVDKDRERYTVYEIPLTDLLTGAGSYFLYTHVSREK